MEDRRAHKRIVVNMKVAYRDSGSAYRMGRVANISRGGMFILTDSPVWNIDDYLFASIDVQEFGKVIWVQGHIVRKCLEGIAVKFTRSDDKGINMLLSSRGVPF
ncbi:MAG: PilZ domain-containing protein [Desulfomonilia bacterium]|jgi:Tfp pilus assembly protein PilZ